MFARECRATALVTFLSSFPVSAQDRLDSFADSTPTRIATVHDDRAPGNSQRLQELDDGFLVIALQLFKLLTYVVCFAMVAQNCVVKRQ
jgi:hypothetical protein